MTNKKPFVKWVLHGIELPLHQNLIYWLSPHCCFGAVSRSYLRCCLPGWGPHLPQIKLNLQLYLFSVDSYGDHEGTQSGLPSFHWTPRGTRALVPAVAPCTHLPPWGVQMNLGKSVLVLEFGAWLNDTEKYPPSQKILGGGLAERCQENCPPSGKVLDSGAQLGKNSGIPRAQEKDDEVAPL